MGTRMAGARSAVELRREASRYVDEPLREAVAELDEPLRQVAEYHLGWAEADGGPVAGPDAALEQRRRGAAVVLAAAGPAARAEARNVAVAATLLCAGLFVQDDLVDGDRVRYGRPTVWTAYGMPAAVQAGNVLSALGLARLGREPSSRSRELVDRLAHWLKVCGSGQAVEVLHRRRGRASPAEVVSVTDAKSGAAGGFLLTAAALVTGADRERLRACTALGVVAARAWQLRNDYEALWTDAADGTKDPLSDLRQRRRTAVAVHALGTGGAAAAELERFYRDTRTPEPAELARALELLEECGAKEWLVGRIGRTLGEAGRLLPKAVPDPDGAQESAALLASFCGHAEL
ncbi:polyprenyl synthetase family protein [Kitasatospora sp. NPDC096147]|uniref:polyprenyl synthetase family protein n=1 Tax=Kitasatospora sp. NPDC096147 TaxID=3364093 RepID=UPI0037F2E8FE